jgi:hypothetical protein
MSDNKVITEPSICIPRTLNNVSWRDVKETMEAVLGKGTVDRVDIVRSKHDEQFCRIFVHMRYWPMTDPKVAAVRETLVSGGEIKVVYNHPWFWKCQASRCAKPDKKKRVSADPYILTDSPPPEKHTVADVVEGALNARNSNQEGDTTLSDEMHSAMAKYGAD